MTAWRPAVFALTAPMLAAGFAASALANRWIFAVWALGASVAGVLTLRRGIEVWRGRPGARLRVAVRLLAVLAPVTALFAWLVGRHQEVLDLGLRAVWPALHSPVLTAPAAYGVAAAVLAVLAVGGWVVSYKL